MFPTVIFIFWFLLLQLPLNTYTLHQEYGLQDGVLSHGVVATYVQPQDKSVFEPQTNPDTVQLLNDLLAKRDETKEQDNLDSVIDWLKKLKTTVPPPIKVFDTRGETRLKGTSLAQFAKILQKSDDPTQKTEYDILNSEAYVAIILKLLQRLDKLANISKSMMQAPKSWNNKILSLYTDKMLEDVSEDNEHTIIQSLRLLLRSIDKNMEHLDKNYHLGQRNTHDKKALSGMNIGTHSLFVHKIH